MKKICVFLSLVAYVVGFTACDDESLPQVNDPLKALYGKWEMSRIGNGNDLYPVGEAQYYEEYLRDSVVRYYEYETKKSTYHKYWIEDSLLYKQETWYVEGEVVEFLWIYEFKFKNHNKLQLDVINWTAINYTSVWVRKTSFSNYLQ